MDRRKLLGLITLMGVAAVPGLAWANDDHGQEFGGDDHGSSNRYDDAGTGHEGGRDD